MLAYSDKSTRFWFPTLLLSMFVVACTPQSSSQGGVQLSAPSEILDTRAINRDNLQPRVSLSDGTTINMQRVGDNNWSGSAMVFADSSYSVTIEWVEVINGRDLRLASWSEPVQVLGEDHTLNIDISQYNFNFDADSDGLTNLEERQQDSNPFVADQGPGQTTSSNTTTAGSTTSGNTTTAGSTTSSNTTTAGSTTSSNTTTAGTTTSSNTTTAGTTTSGTSTSGSTTGSSAPPTLTIPRIADSAPMIDGLGVEQNSSRSMINEWADAAQKDDAGQPLLMDNLMIDVNADSEDGAALRSWAAMHDGTHLYIVVLVDDLGMRRSDSAIPRHDDSVELFIDGDNDKETSWDEDNDYHVIVPLQQLNTSNANSSSTGRFSYGQNSAQPFDFEFFTSSGIGPDGLRQARYEQDIYEFRINLKSADISVGKPFGLEIQVNDDDDGDDRDSKWGWFHPSRSNGNDTDMTVNNPSIMGTVILAE